MIAGPIVAVVLGIALYLVIGPLVFVVATRIFLSIGRAFELPNAIGVFAAEVRRAFRAHSGTIDRDFGPPPGRST